MKFIRDLKEGDRISDIYLCKHKQAAVTKNGKSYENVILQDKTGVIDAIRMLSTMSRSSAYILSLSFALTGR